MEINNQPIDGNYSSWGGYTSGDEAVMQQVTMGQANRFSVFGQDLDLDEAWGEDSDEDNDNTYVNESQDATVDSPPIEGAAIALENATVTGATVEVAPSTVLEDALSDDEVSGIISLTESDSDGNEDEGASDHSMSVVEDDVSFAGSNPEFDDGSSVTDNTSVASSNGSITSEEEAIDALPEEASIEEEEEEVVMALAGQHYILDTIQSMDEASVDRDALLSSPSSQGTNESAYFGPIRRKGTPPMAHGSMSDLPPPAYDRNMHTIIKLFATRKPVLSEGQQTLSPNSRGEDTTPQAYTRDRFHSWSTSTLQQDSDRIPWKVFEDSSL
jgi:hypothetical protein